jgi:hypothetical protein
LPEGRQRAHTMPNPYAEARILVDLGLLYRQEAKEDSVHEQLEEALDIFLRLGAMKDVEWTERALTRVLP